MLDGKRILLIVAGGIAAYKCLELVRRLSERGALAMFGCILGNLMAICGLVALEEGVAFMEVFSRLTPGIAASLLSVTFSPIDLLFYGLALWQGYKLSFRQLSQEELRELAPAAASTATPDARRGA